MNQVRLDLSNFRELTGGDKELEQELFQEFIISSNSLVDELVAAQKDQGKNEEWRKAAHALKGISVNLGAMHLADLAKVAQEKFESKSDEKETLLNSMKEELSSVNKLISDEQGK